MNFNMFDLVRPSTKPQVIKVCPMDKKVIVIVSRSYSKQFPRCGCKSSDFIKHIFIRNQPHYPKSTMAESKWQFVICNCCGQFVDAFLFNKEKHKPVVCLPASPQKKKITFSSEVGS